jgi:GTP-binding protein
MGLAAARPAPYSSAMTITVAIIGRPNVGKSTLFNRLTRSRRAMVHDQPGVTRDRIFGDVERPGGGRLSLIDTGGLLMEDEDRFVPLIRAQAEAAIGGADLVLLLVDGHAGPIPEDREIAGYLRAQRVPVVLLVNKGDRKGVDLQAAEFHCLGLGEPIVISAEHGTGLDELWEAIDDIVPRPPDPGPTSVGEALAEGRAGGAPGAGPGDVQSVEAGPAGGGAGALAHVVLVEDELRVALVGRPNVGKSSLLNRLAGEPRALVSEVPGTTRDTVDVLLEQEGVRFRFLDTAGIRRKGRTESGPEVLSVVLARRYMERAHLALVLIDAVEGVTRQDAHVAGYAWEAGRAVMLVINKWDLVEDREARRQRLEHDLDEQLKFLRHAPRVYLSALSGRGVGRLRPAMLELAAAFTRRSSTSELNHILRDAWQRRPPSVPGRREPKLFYATQAHSAPPGFLLFTNLQQDVHFSYLRYIENVLRQSLSLAGVPIRVMIKGRKS